MTKLRKWWNRRKALRILGHAKSYVYEDFDAAYLLTEKLWEVYCD